MQRGARARGDELLWIIGPALMLEEPQLHAHVVPLPGDRDRARVKVARISLPLAVRDDYRADNRGQQLLPARDIESLRTDEREVPIPHAASIRARQLQYLERATAS
jgi:hypothetical protein